jgi:catechol 2,3-dioxygenase-like lactoylglutathione lyase family enzyme
MEGGRMTKIHNNNGGIPTARNVDHVGITVPSLDQAIAFFTEVLGGQLLMKGDEMESPGGEWTSIYLNVHPNAALRVAMVRLGPTMNVELFEYTAPDQNQRMPKNSDYGASHLAFYVDDMQAAVEYLSMQPGVRFLGEPQIEPTGPTEGVEWVYFLSPWGMQMELVCWSEGLPYEKATEGRMYGPESSWDNRAESTHRSETGTKPAL